MPNTNSLSCRAVRYFPRLPLHDIPRPVDPLWCQARDTPWVTTMRRQVATATLVGGARVRPRVALSAGRHAGIASISRGAAPSGRPAPLVAPTCDSFAESKGYDAVAHRGPRLDWLPQRRHSGLRRLPHS